MIGFYHDRPIIKIMSCQIYQRIRTVSKHEEQGRSKRHINTIYNNMSTQNIKYKFRKYKMVYKLIDLLYDYFNSITKKISFILILLLNNIITCILL